MLFIYSLLPSFWLSFFCTCIANPKSLIKYLKKWNYALKCKTWLQWADSGCLLKLEKHSSVPHNMKETTRVVINLVINGQLSMSISDKTHKMKGTGVQLCCSNLNGNTTSQKWHSDQPWPVQPGFSTGTLLQDQEPSNLINEFICHQTDNLYLICCYYTSGATCSQNQITRGGSRSRTTLLFFIAAIQSAFIWFSFPMWTEENTYLPSHRSTVRINEFIVSLCL